MRDGDAAPERERAVPEVEACQKMRSVIATGKSPSRPAQSHTIDRAADLSGRNPAPCSMLLVLDIGGPLVPQRYRFRNSAALKCRSCRTRRYKPHVHMVKLTMEREIAPYVWVHPDEER
jgi:hypothetical protein